ncbi:hypothetical protein C0992_011371, partial [Termitomyces sp. T32_za158]
ARIPPETRSQRQHHILAESASPNTPPLPDTPQLPRALPRWRSRSTVLTYARTTPPTAPATRPPPAVVTGHSPGAKNTPSPPAPAPIAPEPTTPVPNPLADQPATHTTAPPPATDTEAATACDDHLTPHLPPTQRLYPYRTLTGSRVPGPVQQTQKGRLPQATSSSHTTLPTPSRDLQDPSPGLLRPATTTTTTLLHQELFEGDLSPAPPSVPPTPLTSTTPPPPLPSSTSVAASQQTNLLQHQPTMEQTAPPPHAYKRPLFSTEVG